MELEELANEKSGKMRSGMRLVGGWLRRHQMLTILVAVVAVIWLARIGLNERTEREWRAYVKDARASGIPMTFADLALPPIPDEENIAAMPEIQSWIDGRGARPESVFELPTEMWLNALVSSQGKWRNPDWKMLSRVFLSKGWITNQSENFVEDVRRGIASRSGAFAEWEKYATRPKCRLPDLDEKNSMIFGGRVYSFDKSAQFFFWVLRAAVADGDGNGSMKILREWFHVYWSLRGDRSTLLGYGIVRDLGDWIGIGLQEQIWDAEQLSEIAELLNEIDVHAEIVRAMTPRRVWLNWDFEQILADDPTDRAMKLIGWRRSRAGWDGIGQFVTGKALSHRRIREVQLTMNRYLDALADTDDPVPDIRWEKTIGPNEEGKVTSISWPERIERAVNSRPRYRGERLQWWRTGLNQCRLAVALERYRLQTGAVPENLEPLVSENLCPPLLDHYSGEAMKYHLESGGEYFSLYSVGFDGTDDGGVFRLKNGDAQKDLVWLFAPKR